MVSENRVFGVNAGRLTVLTHQIRLTFDARDHSSIPTEGLFAQFTYDVGDDSLGGDVGYNRFSLELILHIPKFKRRAVTVLRFAGWIMTGKQIPFYELTKIGGRSTIRGYGEARFVDRNGFVVNIEERVKITEIEIMGNRLWIQLAGFVDFGRVYAEADARTFKDTKIAAGAAVRLIVTDSDLVTSIDMGFSDEGTAVFVNLDYPF